MNRLKTAAVAAAIISALALSACGSSSLDEADAGTASSLPTAQVDQALADRVPADLKSAGTLIDGSDGSYAPNEFIGTDGKSMEGMDVDLLNAIGTTLGLKVEYNNAGFDTIILGVTSGKYDIAISSFTINDERMKQVNMVQYFNAGTSWATKKGNPNGVDPSNACGLTVAVQKGTVQVDDLEAKSKACVDAGKKAIVAVVEAEQSKATANVVSGKADATLADSPIAAYAVKQSGELELVGEMYDAAPYGIVVPKADSELATLVSEALAKLKADGVYDAILAKWGNTSGAVTAFPVNP